MDRDLGDERRLLEGARSGDRGAAEELIRLHHAGVYRFLFHLTRDADRADDLTQETFAAAWRRIGTFGGRSSLATWLHRIAFGKFADARRRLRRDGAKAAGLRDFRPGSGVVDPLEALVCDERAERLYGAIQALAEPERVAVVLHYLQGLSLREVADVLGRPVGTVKWRTSRALARLRDLLAEDGDDAGRALAASRTEIGRPGPGVGPPVPPPPGGPRRPP